MDTGAELIELLELQASAELVAKSELLHRIRSRGQHISDRTLAFYTAESLVPSPMRVGRRGVVYPALAVAQVEFVVYCRDHLRLSLENTRELLPLWRAVQRGLRDRRVDLAELEFVARTHVLTVEANYAVPLVINHSLAAAHDLGTSVSWTLKNGCQHEAEPGAPLTLGFLMAELDQETRLGRVVAWTQLRLPGFDVDAEDPYTLVLGIPVGVRLEVGASGAPNAERDPSGRSSSEDPAPMSKKTASVEL